MSHCEIASVKQRQSETVTHNVCTLNQRIPMCQSTRGAGYISNPSFRKYNARRAKHSGKNNEGERGWL